MENKKVADLEDGIYFDLPEDEYHALPRLSSTGVNRLLRSPSEFWFHSWMNPDRPEEDKGRWAVLGKAYHTAILEPLEFNDRFAVELRKEEYPDALFNDTDVREALAELGQPKTNSGEMALARARRLLEVKPDAQIWSLIGEKFAADNEGKDVLSTAEYREVRKAMENVHHSDEISQKIEEGQPEVSVMWTDPETSVRCKARFDFLSPAHWCDVKTWDPKSSRPADIAIQDAFRFQGYYRSAWFYLRAAETIRAGYLPIVRHANKMQTWLIDEIRTNEDPMRLFYIWHRKGGIPDLRVREAKFYHLPPGVEEQATGASTVDFRHYTSRWALKARDEVRDAMQVFASCADFMGTDGEPWFPPRMVGAFTDDDFSEYWLDSREVAR